MSHTIQEDRSPYDGTADAKLIHRDSHFGDYWHQLTEDQLLSMELPTIAETLHQLLSVRWVSVDGGECKRASRARTTRNGIPLVEIRLIVGRGDYCRAIVEQVPYDHLDAELHIFIETAQEILSFHPKWVES